ncbi:MAG: FG-GAP-like repeat-containing protein [Phycisphaerales bacterium]
MHRSALFCLAPVLLGTPVIAQCDPATVLAPGIRTFLSAISGPSEIRAADLNNDGNQDLVITEFSSDTVAVMLGAGDGTFAAPDRYDFTFGIGLNPSGLAVADFTGDTVPDLAIGNAGSSTVTILVGIGDGTFTAGGEFDAGFFVQPRDIATADLDNDGDTDIVVSSEANQVRVLHNDGTGSFAPPIFTVVIGTVSAVELADVNGDQIPDAVVSDFNGFELEVAFGDGAGGFEPFNQYDTIMTPTDLKLADMDQDGDLDVVVCGLFDEVTVHINAGNGSFHTHNSTTTLSVPLALDLADLDLDGQIDVLVATASTNPQTISLFSGIGNGTLGAEIAHPGLQGANGVVMSDFDNDGATDAAVIFEISNDIMVYLNTCDETGCAPDLAAPFGVLNFFDISAFITAFNAMDPAADFAAPFGVFNFFDVAAYIDAYNAGCP